ERDRQKAELNVVHRHGALNSEHLAEDMRDAVLAVVETTAKQARRARKKFMDQRRRTDRQVAEEAQWQAATPAGDDASAYEDFEEHWPVDVIDAATLGHDEGPKIVKTQNLPIKPMSIREASVELQNSKNEFFVFLDSRTEQVSVLYRRKDSNFGLIAPEF
ncbi:MAG: sigma 54 modulation/S30EA ribosomal C-terminal domain-containing protein, partial [Acidobacteriota bacterium]